MLGETHGDTRDDPFVMNCSFRSFIGNFALSIKRIEKCKVREPSWSISWEIR